MSAEQTALFLFILVEKVTDPKIEVKAQIQKMSVTPFLAVFEEQDKRVWWELLSTNAIIFNCKNDTGTFKKYF